ncbi:MAG: type VI secretion system protein TssA [Janthinobacterium lividum]
MTDTSPAFFDADIDRVLLPIACDNRVGTSLRYTGTYQEIRQARQEDDATLPQGEWERPLKKADWPLVVRLCLRALQSESKDFQIAAWLCEAWVRLHGVRGMSAGVRMLDGLVEHFWPDAYPPYKEEGKDGEDGEARIGILMWLRETLVVALTMYVPLLEFDDIGEPALNLDDWERLVAGNPAPPGRDRPDRATLAAQAVGPRLEGLLAMRYDIPRVREQWALFARRIDDMLGSDSLSLSAVADRLAALERAARSLSEGRAPSPASHAPPAGEGDTSDLSPASDVSRKAANDPAVSSSHAVHSREQAYAVLAQVAVYLREHEPHSPTPYLIERALAWGRLPLHELMDEVLSEEGGMRWYAAMLGLDANRE